MLNCFVPCKKAAPSYATALPHYLCPTLSLSLLTATVLVSGLLGLSIQFLSGGKLLFSLLTGLCMPASSPAAGGWPCPAPTA